MAAKTTTWATSPLFPRNHNALPLEFVYPGGDCDTLTCIAGSIVEGFYGVPEDLKQECRNRLPEQLLEVLQKFDSFLNR